MVLDDVIRFGAMSLSVLRGDRAALQNARLRARGLGWKAVRCPNPLSCDLDLCVADDQGRQWHPVEPLAFAKWRVRGNLEAIPPEVVVRIGWGGWGGFAGNQRLLLGALGVGCVVVAAAFLLARHAGSRRVCST